jgi:hypothetical protein
MCIGRTINKSAHAGANLQLVAVIANLILFVRWFDGSMVEMAGIGILLFFKQHNHQTVTIKPWF